MHEDSDSDSPSIPGPPPSYLLPHDLPPPYQPPTVSSSIPFSPLPCQTLHNLDPLSLPPLCPTSPCQFQTYIYLPSLPVPLLAPPYYPELPPPYSITLSDQETRGSSSNQETRDSSSYQETRGSSPDHFPALSEIHQETWDSPVDHPPIVVNTQTTGQRQSEAEAHAEPFIKLSIANMDRKASWR
ncbi:hypothetical protein FKM82_013154 [Ascaphus truei]